MKTLKVGLLLNDRYCNRYIYELVCWAQEQADVEISNLVIYKSPPTSWIERMRRLIYGQALGRLASVLLFRFIVILERTILQFYSLHRGHFDTLDLVNKIDNRTTIELASPGIEAVQQFASDQVQLVKNLELDLLIMFGQNVMQGEILQASRLGIIAVASVGNGIDQGAPPGFWECYLKQPKTGFVIQSLVGDNRRNVLLSGFFRTRFLFSLNQANLYRKIGPHLQQLLKEIAVRGVLPNFQRHQPYSGEILDPPRFTQSAQYLLKIAGRIGARTLFKIAHYQKRWGISFTSSGWKKALLWNGINAKAPRGHFWADPFIYEHNDRTYCFVENYVYKTGRAHISALEVTESTVRELGDCIREPFHLSFPFLFKFDGDLYMSPECNKSQEIRIYRCTGFPLQWELASVAMDSISAADTMIFEHGGVWWMLTSIDHSGCRDYCSELYLFSANSPLSADWKAHPQNPVRIDSEGGRNAGVLFDDGKIFRLAQRQGFDQYGQGLLMYEITELSATGYSETLFSEISPNFKKGLLGVHHLSATAKITVFDHVSRAFVF